MRILLLVIFFVMAMNSNPTLAQPAELMLAARSGDIEQVRILLASGVEPDPEGIASPLYFAAQSGHIEIVELLLESDADPNRQSNWGTALQIAARRGHADLAISLLQSGADPNAMGGEFGNAPLHEAAATGDVEIGRLLINFGADVNLRNSRFEPPIHVAVSESRDTFADLLRDAGAGGIAVDPISDEIANADIEAGRIRALECTNCHRLENRDDAPGSYGPRLWNIVGREVAVAGERERFPYSEAMIAQSGNWTIERLNAFLADPYGTIPGTGMYAGFVADRTERINVIAYLGTLSDDPDSQ